MDWRELQNQALVDDGLREQGAMRERERLRPLLKQCLQAVDDLISDHETHAGVPERYASLREELLRELPRVQVWTKKG